MGSREITSKEMSDDLVHRQCREISKHTHVGKLKRRPLPTIRLAADNSQRRSALHGEGEEDHQRHRAAERQIVTQRGLQAERLSGGIGSIQGAERTDDDFARDDGAEQTYPDLPVEAKRLDDGLNPLTYVSDQALRQCRVKWYVAQNPEDHGDAQDDRSRLLEEDLAAIDNAQPEGAQGRQPVLRQFENKGRGSSLKNRRLEQSGGAERSQEAHEIQRKHHRSAQAEETAEDWLVRNEGRDHQQINRQARR